jgi:hypothetical protein
MTDANKTADILAAWQLIEEHGLDVTQSIFSGYVAGDRYEPDPHGKGPTRIAAVRAWAESAGVPWPAVKVVQRWACMADGEIGSAYTTPQNFAIVLCVGDCGTVVPC